MSLHLDRYNKVLETLLSGRAVVAKEGSGYEYLKGVVRPGDRYPVTVEHGIFFEDVNRDGQVAGVPVVLMPVEFFVPDAVSGWMARHGLDVVGAGVSEADLPKHYPAQVTRPWSCGKLQGIADVMCEQHIMVFEHLGEDGQRMVPEQGERSIGHRHQSVTLAEADCVIPDVLRERIERDVRRSVDPDGYALRQKQAALDRMYPGRFRIEAMQEAEIER